MQWSDIPRKPDNQTLRRFAGMCLVCFGALATWQGLVRHQAGLGLLGMAGALGVGLTGLARPQTMRLVYVGWMMAVFPIGWMISVLALAVVYYAVLTPIGVVFKLGGRDALCRRPHADKGSYWVVKPAAADPARYLRPF